MKIKEWLSSSISSLETNNVPSPRLDCLVLLENVLKKNRSLILAHLDDELTKNQYNKLSILLDQRIARKPLAYILNNKEFYNNNFYVNQDVLIPRPASEDIIDIFKKLEHNDGDRVIDVGTGSGILAITINNLFPNLDIDAIDISDSAIKVAKRNSHEHNAKINLFKSNLLDNVFGPYKTIIANLPYVAMTKEIAIELGYEPEAALFAEDAGLEIIFKLIEQINRTKLSNDGHLILESDIDQHHRIIQKAKQHNLMHINTYNLVLLFKYIKD